MSLERKGKSIYWVGTIGGGVAGNIDQISPFMKACKKNHIKFIHSCPWAHPISFEENRNLIQKSYMAPTICGTWQLENGYIPCRIFKNISYGQLGITNSKRVYDLFQGKIVYNEDSYQLFYDAKKALKLCTQDQMYELMDFVKASHTYLNRTEHILNFIELLQKENDSNYAEGDQDKPDIFTKIYSNQVWGKNSKGRGHSGGGSTLEATITYRQFLQDFLEEYNVKSVVDVRCGDWEFSKTISWEGINYTGYDVVPFVIKNNIKMYGSDSIRFICEDAVSVQLPSADLLICKDVLQHISNEDITLFISQLSKFKYCLITNDIGPRINTQISRGDHRPVDLTLPPFEVPGSKVLSYTSEGIPKQTILIVN